MRARLDATDWRILKELQANGRITNVELARKVGISPPPFHSSALVCCTRVAVDN